MLFPVNGVGDLGIILDVLPHELPPNAWTGGRNVRFNSQFVEKSAGTLSLWGGATVPPYFLLNARDAIQNFWLYAGLAAVYATDGVTHTDVTRLAGAYIATADLNWTGGVLNGIPVLNNGLDVPQYWALPLSVGTKLIALPNWNAAWLAATLRTYKNFLVAVDVTKSGTRYPQMVKWSHPADPGLVPSSWDEADATKDAGEYSLSETPGSCVDSVPLRDTNIVYKDDSIWGMQFTGGAFVHRFYNIAREIGLLSRRCAVEYLDGQHAVFGTGDIVVHNGQTLKSIVTQRVRKTIFAAIDGDAYVRSFTIHNEPKKEVWFCYPETGQAAPNKALVWGYDKNSFGFRDITAAHMASGIIDSTPTSQAWDADSGTWEADTTLWDAGSYSPAIRRLLEADPTNSLFLYTDEGNQFNGSNMTSYIERTGLAIPLKAGLPPDLSVRKMVTRIWPRITGTPGGVVNVYLGSQEKAGDAVVYVAAKGFTIGTTKHLDFRVGGTLFAVKFESTTDITWKLDGYELEVAFLGL